MNCENLTFEDAVKRRKAIEWLSVHDAFVRQAISYAMRSEVNAMVVAADLGATIKEKIDEVAKRMVVTEEERKHGYPVCTGSEIVPGPYSLGVSGWKKN